MFSFQIMNSKSCLIASAAMLALLATILEAKSVERRYRHMKDNQKDQIKQSNEDDPAEMLPKRNHMSRHDAINRRRRGFARWNIPQEE